VVIAGRNAWRDLDRSNRRRRAREMGAAGTATSRSPVRPGVHRQLPETPSAIDEYLARLEIVEVIRTQLTRRQQMVALRIFVDGWSLERVADQIGLSPRMVREEKAKAIAQIRKALLADQDS
jgi:DNA-directed RNA polymerase specialized sigma24 family protein